MDVEVACAHLFGDRQEIAQKYAQHLVTTGVEWGLIGPREADRIWERHILNCVVVKDLIPQGASVADVGSGAGLPGLVLAIARPDISMTLIEPMERRTSWLKMVISDLQIPVTVIRGRADEVHDGQYFDVVTSRAVAALDKLSRWCLPLVEKGGIMLAMKGASALKEVEKAKYVIAKLGGQDVEVVTAGQGVLEPPTRVVRVRLLGRGR